MLRNELKIAIRFTLLTTVLLGILYPLAVTAFGHFFLRSQADGELIVTNGQVTGSPLIGQNFTGDLYFHGRPSAAGNGYDATSSGASNLLPRARSWSRALTAMWRTMPRRTRASRCRSIWSPPPAPVSIPTSHLLRPCFRRTALPMHDTCRWRRCAIWCNATCKDASSVF